MFADAQDWHQRLRVEAPKAWQSLEEFAANLEGVYVATTENKKAASGEVWPAQKRRVKFRINGKMAVIHETSDPAGGELVRGLNSRYAFMLSRRSPAAAFTIDRFSQPTDKTYREFTDDSLARDVKAAWYVIARPLTVLLKEPGFVIRKVLPLEREGKTLLRVEYSYKPRPDENPRLAIPSGWVLLDPDNHWCIEESEREVWYGKIAGTYSYGERVNGFPVLRRYSLTLSDRQGSVTEITCEFERIAHRIIPEHEFTLAAFGLPGLEGEYSNTGRTWFLLLVLALVTGLMAIALRRFVKYRSQRAM